MKTLSIIKADRVTGGEGMLLVEVGISVGIACAQGLLEGFGDGTDGVDTSQVNYASY